MRRALATYLRRLTTLWWVLFIAIVGAVGATAITDALTHPIYSARAVLAFRPAPGLAADIDLVRLLDNLDQTYLDNTMADVLAGHTTLRQAIAQAGLPGAAIDDYDIQTKVDPDNRSITITGAGPDAAHVVAYVNAVAGQAAQVSTRLYRIVTFTIVEPAVLPPGPSRPAPTRDLPLAAGLGFALGCLLILFLDYLNNG